MAFLHMCACFNVPGAFGPGVPLCTVVPRDVHFKKKKKMMNLDTNMHTPSQGCLTFRFVSGR